MKSRIINSTVLLLAAYYVVHFTYLITQFLALKLLDMENLSFTFFYNSFPAPEHSWWTRLKVFLVCGSGIFAVFVLVFLIALFIYKLSKKRYKLGVFYNWILMVSGAFIIAEFMAAPIFNHSTFMHSLLAWLGFESGGGGMYLVGILFLLFIPVVSYFTNEAFITTTNTTANIRTRSARLKIYFSLTLVPYFVLIIVLSLMLNASFSYDLKYILAREGMRFAALFIIIIFGAYFSFNKNFISVQKQNDFNRVNIPLTMLILIVLFVLFFISYMALE